MPATGTIEIRMIGTGAPAVVDGFSRVSREMEVTGRQATFLATSFIRLGQTGQLSLGMLAREAMILKSVLGGPGGLAGGLLFGGIAAAGATAGFFFKQDVGRVKEIRKL